LFLPVVAASGYLRANAEMLPRRTCDETWGFVGCEEKHNQSGNPEFGDAHSPAAIERTSKLFLAWHLGRRTIRDTEAFAEKLNEATQGNFQITTDAFPGYFNAIHMSLGPALTTLN
jgi:hypothetical protein